MASKSTKSATQKAAAKRVAKKSTSKPVAKKASTTALPYGNADTETQKATAGMAQLPVEATGTAGEAVSRRRSRIDEALAERERVMKEETRHEKQAVKAEQEQVAAVMTDLEAPPRAPTTNPLQQPLKVGETGVSPDVTSPTNLMHSTDPKLPGTGVADPRDLAPGQDMSPSPPISSSNILPQPDKPGTPFSQL